jgi:predicted nucleic acid-binding protein
VTIPNASKVAAGFDTGFFVELYEKHSQALEVWRQVDKGEVQGVVSCITLFELGRLDLRGALPQGVAELFRKQIPDVCSVVWLGQENETLLDRAARVAHGSGLSMADALILTSLMEAGAEVIYTTDGDFEAYRAGPRIVKL